MQIPFTAGQFLGVFRTYNTTLWPAQVLLLALAGLAVVLVLWMRSWSDVGVSAILAFLGGWMGLAYHLALAVVPVVGLILFWKAGSPTGSPPQAAGAAP